VRFSSMAVSISVFSVLTAWPKSRRSSGASADSAFISAVTCPDFRLRKASCRAFSAWSEEAEGSCARNASRTPWIAGLSGTCFGGERGLGLRRHLGKCGGLRRGHVREHLAIERDAGRLEAAHQLRIGEAVLARAGVDAHDPQAA